MPPWPSKPATIDVTCTACCRPALYSLSRPFCHQENCASKAAAAGALLGFTLMEVMVVLLLLSILAAIAVPSYQESMRKARRAEGKSALLAVMQQQERHYSDTGTYVAMSGRVPHGFKWYSGDSPASSAYEIVATACKNDSLRHCVQLSAKPGTSRVNAGYRDHACGELELNSAGEKRAGGNACW